MQFALSLVTVLCFSLVQQSPVVYRVGRDVSAPRVMSRVEPRYSEAALAAMVQGTVVLEAVIGADGVPKVVRVVRSLGYGLDESAIAALERWRFNPARKDGVAVNVSLNVEINFNLAANPTNSNIEALVATRSGMSLQLPDSSAAGEWRIAGIDLRPEDLISVNYGGHSPWRNNPVEVARVAVQPLYNVSSLPESCVTPPTDTASGVADIDVCGDSRNVVRVVRLHSGEWRVIRMQSRR